jgi:hypothetical protein
MIFGINSTSRQHGPSECGHLDIHSSATATYKVKGNFQRFSTADLYHFTIGIPSERFSCMLQVAV